MFKSYIKIALKVLLRSKFFTLVSLSGITFTLSVLIIAVAFVDHMMSPGDAGSKLDRTLFVENMELKSENIHVSSHPGYLYLDRYVRPLKTPEAVSIHTLPKTASIYVRDQRIDLQLKHTDAVFWDILELDFTEGAPFDQQAVDNADYVAVISERTRAEVFGDEPAVGQYLETTQGSFRVLGTIPEKEIPTMMAAADVYVPITTSQQSMNSKDLWSGHMAFVLAGDEDQFEAIKTEYAGLVEQAYRDYEGEYELIRSPLGTQAELMVSHFFGEDSEAGTMAVFGVIIGSMLLFMLFPAINLISLNVTRIMERSSEIGVRKAFGASSLSLVSQFLTENIILTLIGGVMAWIVSWLTLRFITEADSLPYGQFEPSLTFFVYCLLICLAFGIVSGVYPAYRMSRMQPVDALRGVES